MTFLFLGAFNREETTTSVRLARHGPAGAAAGAKRETAFFVLFPRPTDILFPPAKRQSFAIQLQQDAAGRRETGTASRLLLLAAAPPGRPPRVFVTKLREVGKSGGKRLCEVRGARGGGRVVVVVGRVRRVVVFSSVSEARRHAEGGDGDVHTEVGASLLPISQADGARLLRGAMWWRGRL